MPNLSTIFPQRRAALTPWALPYIAWPTALYALWLLLQSQATSYTVIPAPVHVMVPDGPRQLIAAPWLHACLWIHAMSTTVCMGRLAPFCVVLCIIFNCASGVTKRTLCVHKHAFSLRVEHVCRVQGLPSVCWCQRATACRSYWRSRCRCHASRCGEGAGRHDHQGEDAHRPGN